MSGSFVDSNILVYVLSADRRKANISERLLEDGPTISVQVLNEVALVLHRKHAMQWSALRDFLDKVRSVVATVVPVTTDVHDIGLDVAQRYRLHVFDSMIIAAALLAQCDTLYSEDMQHGLVVDGRLRIVDPFHAGP